MVTSTSVFTQPAHSTAALLMDYGSCTTTALATGSLWVWCPPMSVVFSASFEDQPNVGISGNLECLLLGRGR